MIPLRDINPTRRFPILTIVLIGINVLVFLYQQSLPERALENFVFRFGMQPAFVLSDFDQYGYTLVTSMFLHGDWLHIGSNMLYLWIFGNNIEDRLGLLRYLLFYFITGFAAGGAQIAIDPGSTVPNIGASGAIAGVLGAYVVLFPRARVQTLIFLFYFIQIVEVSAGVLLGWWFLLQVISGLVDLGAGPGGAAQGGIAFFAHIGGFVTGWLLIRIFAVGRPARQRREDVLIPNIDDIFQPGRRKDRWWD
ncbi:MAG TPA: rhomboid family intramembrane serine protease [Anaerolineae bacterium]|nr:rhomboid family intramembrane serine protease [Anaerolineae bacterium]